MECQGTVRRQSHTPSHLGVIYYSQSTYWPLYGCCKAALCSTVIYFVILTSPYQFPKKCAVIISRNCDATETRHMIKGRFLNQTAPSEETRPQWHQWGVDSMILRMLHKHTTDTFMRTFLDVSDRGRVGKTVPLQLIRAWHHAFLQRVRREIVQHHLLF